ncbi:hypothetical protein [Rhodococcus sp. X156]|uniref:hypothetical protein n=1 Tax=Rhodococcus sp. X156 TaxID=2499145 RepID=UPI000FD8EF2D|nr:hypothetical protein [Rhodococcus sp. X156]
MIGYVIVAATGYVMGTKAGRERYELINRNYQRIANSPTTRKLAVIARDVARDKLLVALDAPSTRQLEPLDADGTVYVEKQRGAARTTTGPTQP